MDLAVPDVDELPLAMGQLKEEMKSLNNYMANMSGRMDHAFWETMESIQEVGTMHLLIRELESIVGKQKRELVEKDMVLTLWDDIGSLDEDINTLSLTKADGQDRKLLSLKSDLWNVLGTYKEGIENLGIQLSDLKTQLINHTSITRVEDDPDSLMSAVLNSTYPPTNTAGPASTVGLGIAMSGNTDPSVGETLNSRTKTLEEYNRHRDNQALIEAVRICDVTFTNEDDVESWLTKHGPNPDCIPKYGSFIDPLLLLHWAWSRLSGKEVLHELTSQKKLDMTDLDLKCRQSYGMDVPYVFTGSGGSSLLDTSGLEKSRFANVKSFQSWESHGLINGLRKRIESALNMIKTALSARIEKEFRGYPVLSSLAKEMLNISYTFVLSLNQYMTDTFQSFSSFEIGTEKEIWGLITFVVEQLFKKDFAEMRQVAIGSFDLENRDSGFMSIWCALWCVKLSRNLIVTGIKDTPSVSASYVRFVLTQSNMGKLGKLVDENLKLKHKAEALVETSLEEVKKLATEAMKRADQAMSKVTQSKKKKKNDDDE